MHNAVLPVAY